MSTPSRLPQGPSFGAAPVQDPLHAQVAELRQMVHALFAQQQTIPYMHNAPFANQMLDQEVRYGFQGRGEMDDSEAYRVFEDLFRGPADRVKELQAPYIEMLRGHGPVLDVGCGRGEFLDLLRDAGIPYQGVDLDQGMIEEARKNGHTDVFVGDGIEYLRSLEDNSLGAVFAAQVIEHLPYQQFLDFLRLSHQKLKPGGLFIAETVNPHVPTSLKVFWTDLTHQHPIFPEVALAYAWITGFETGYLFYPRSQGNPDLDRLTCDAYAVVARTAQEPA